MSQILYMASSIKAGGRSFIYDFTPQPSQDQESDVAFLENMASMDLGVAFLT
jgi:hypothetical protein